MNVEFVLIDSVFYGGWKEFNQLIKLYICNDMINCK
jgi:hypothetical protein